MFAVNYRELNQLYRVAGAQECVRTITDMFNQGRRGEPGGLRAEEFTSIRALAEAVVPSGREWVDAMNPFNRVNGFMASEAGQAVDSTAFSNITGQIVYNLMMERYQAPEYVFTRLVRNRPTRFKDGEKVPGTTGIVNENMDPIHEQMPYPHATIGEDWLLTPSLEKRGTIVAVSEETIFSDNIGRIQDDARNVGDLITYNKEVRLVDHAVGVINTYNRQGSVISTYQSGPTPWKNDHANLLTDYKAIDASRMLWADMTDPNTGKEILISGTVVVTSPHKTMEARRIINATEIRTGDITSGAGTQTISANPVAGLVTHYESQIMHNRIISKLSQSAGNAKEWWLHMDPSKFLVYMEGWPLRVLQAPPQNSAQFDRDIVVQFKASEFGVPAILDPLYTIRNKHS